MNDGHMKLVYNEPEELICGTYLPNYMTNVYIANCFCLQKASSGK